MSQQPKTGFLGMRIDADLMDQVRQAASEETRTITNQVIHFIKLGLAARDAEKARQQ